MIATEYINYSVALIKRIIEKPTNVDGGESDDGFIHWICIIN